MESSKAQKYGFASYDFSNSGFVIIFQSFLFPIVLNEALNGSKNDYLWPAIVTISSILAVIAAPFIGRMADHHGKAKVFATTVIVTALLAAIGPVFLSSSALLLAILFVIFNLFFELSQSLYDSFLVNFEKTVKGITNLSSFAWGFGYLGGSLFVGLYLLFEKMGLGTTLSLFIFGLLYLLLSVPSMRSFKKLSPSVKTQSLSFREYLRVKPPVPWRDLVIYWLIADVVTAILYFAPLYLQQDIGLSLSAVGALLLGGQILAFPMTLIVGRVANRIGQLKAIRWSLLIWALGIFGLVLAENIYHLIPVIILLSFVLGSTQSLMRAHFGSRIHERGSGESFGFFAIAQKSASIVSPALVLLTTLIFEGFQVAFFVLGIILCIAFFVSRYLPHPEENHAIPVE